MEIISKSIFDNTTKIGLKLEDFSTIEIAIIEQKNTVTICLSSQVGCPMGCTFCYSGKSYSRNLKADEIEKEFEIAKSNILSDKKINLVFMGIGEPLLNLDNILQFIEKICKHNKTRFSKNRITISTIGIPDKILELSLKSKNIIDNDQSTINLAISLHFTEDEIRQRYMPKANKISEIFEACVKYQKNSLKSQQIMIEYIMFDNINDNILDAQKLVQLIKKYNIRAIVNLIPYNGLEYKASLEEKIKDFKNIIMQSDIKCFVRKNYSSNISSACGMLMSK